jgi:GT2 family glycosyltransferase
MCSIAYIIPTRNRPRELSRTLEAIGGLRLSNIEVIIADNGSAPPVNVPGSMNNGAPVRVIRLGDNSGAAARNIAAKATNADWLVMLDDDSRPLDDGVYHAISGVAADVAAIGGEIFLANSRREAGGLPEVFVGCGVAIRREAFDSAGGYDPSFQYYAEEYDLAAKLILGGWRVTHDRRFRVLHEKSLRQRSMDRICGRLVRNNAWVAARYAPRGLKRASIVRDSSRYARIAIRENAMVGYGIGFAQMCMTLGRQPKRTMSPGQWDRFVGLASVREAFDLNAIVRNRPVVCVVERGKNDWVIDQVIREFGLPVTDDPVGADALVIGSCSPGPMLDGAERWAAEAFTVIEPWRFGVQAGENATGIPQALTLAA